MGHAARFAALLAVIGLLVGCPSVANFTTAKALGSGQHEIVVSPGAFGFTSGVIGEDIEASETIIGGTLDLGWRMGVGSGIDFGVRVSNLGNLGDDLKLGLVQGEVFRMAVDPSFGGMYLSVEGTSAGYIQYALPLLMDLAPSDVVTFVVGPRYSGIAAFTEKADKVVHFAGGTFGVEIGIGETRAFRIQVHGSFDYWLDAPAQASSTYMFAAGVAFKFGFGAWSEPAAPPKTEGEVPAPDDSRAPRDRQRPQMGGKPS